jgi:hypothetical protein
LRGGMRRILGGCRRLWQSRHALRDQDRQIEDAQADRYDEKPNVQLAGDPVKANQVLLHQLPHASSLATPKHTPVMLRCNMKTGKSLLKSVKIVLRRAYRASGERERDNPGAAAPGAMNRHKPG